MKVGNESTSHHWAWVAWVLVAGAMPAIAHNGALTLAVPVSGITVDGDFSDWPADLVRYPISLPGWGIPPRDTADFQADLRVGYSVHENAVYLAVEVKDESAVIDTSSTAPWWMHDGCEVELDEGHAEDDEFPVGQYIMRNTIAVIGNAAKMEDFAVAVQREAKVQRYEWRLDVTKKSGGSVQLRPGMCLGFDIAVRDKDADGSFSWVSRGPGLAGFSLATRDLGDLLLVEAPPAGLGHLRGHASWQGSDQGVAHAEVRLRSGKTRIDLTADSSGVFRADLPAGPYQLQLHWPGAGNPTRQVAVRVDSRTEVHLEAPPPLGRQVPAGPGRGQWKTFGVTDGLPTTTVLSLFQDRKGRIWVGTEAGVTRYDGHTCTTLTTADGLVSNAVYSILEDHQGNMWFGTDSGASRYDGLTFATYDTTSGLASRWVNAIIEDHQGSLWFGCIGGVTRFDGTHFTTFTDKDGLAHNSVATLFEDTHGVIWAGGSAGVSHFDGNGFSKLSTQHEAANSATIAITEDHQGNLWFGAQGVLQRFDGTRVTLFTAKEGLPAAMILALCVDRDGVLWLGTDGSGVLRFDGKAFRTFAQAEGLAGNTVNTILQDREGTLWFGTDAGLSQYQGEQLKSFTTVDGLLDNRVWSLLEDRQGALWFSMAGQRLFAVPYLGASRYDGRTFQNLTAIDGLKAGDVIPTVGILEDQQGALWFGATRYDGKYIRPYTVADGMVSLVSSTAVDHEGTLWAGGMTGLSRFREGRFAPFDTLGDIARYLSGPQHFIASLVVDHVGQLWFGTYHGGGVGRYDGRETKVFTRADGLGEDGAVSLYEDQGGILWIGHWGGGISRYDGQGFRTWSMKDGLGGNQVWAALQDKEGRMLFGTFGGGLSLFDGLVFQNLTTQDGLADNRVTDLLQDRHGDIWIATLGGVTRYRPYRTPPPIEITEITADHRYGPVSTISLSTSQDYLAFEFQGRSLKTRPGQMAYVYRLQGYDEDWQVTREERVVYADLPRGDYTFEVKAVDRDLTYSETPATVRVAVHLPYNQLLLYGVLAVSLVGLGLTASVAMRRRQALVQEQRARLQAQEQLNRELEDELQTAHDLQMGLMPKSPPHIPGLDIAGQCMPANHVGGDFFQYFQREGILSICLADVTGHGMEAAIPMVMFSGMLSTEQQYRPSLHTLFANLNRNLHQHLDNHTFVCFSMAEIGLAANSLQLANAGIPYPLHYRAATGKASELRLDAYPLGVRPETQYETISMPLEPGDYVVWCSDGIIEAANGQGGFYGFDRTAEVVGEACAVGLPAAQLVERILSAVKAVSGEVAQADDQTVVVLRVNK